MNRADGRADHELRPVTFTRGFQQHPAGSVLVEFGGTKVLCAASVTTGVPRWRKGSGLGWLTAPILIGWPLIGLVCLWALIDLFLIPGMIQSDKDGMRYRLGSRLG